MNVQWRKACAVAVVCGMAGLWGCGESGGGGGGATLSFSYDRPAKMEIPMKIKSLAVQPDDTSRNADARWGLVAADEMIEQLKAANAQNRYDIVERAALKKMLDEADLQMAFGNPDEAARNTGKLKAIDAIVYVRTNVSTEQRSAKRAKVGMSGVGEESYTKYFASANMSFKLVDLATGSTLASLAPRKSYDSDKDEKKSTMSALIGGSSNVPATDVILGKLIEEGVAEFVGMISPHAIRVDEKLSDGKSPAVKSGNGLALAGDYNGALALYLQALDQKPDDHGAAFNAGLMYEAMGKFSDAHKMYARAAGLYSKDARYGKALSRVGR